MPAKKDKDEEARHSDNPTLDELKAKATPKADPENGGHSSPDDAPKATRAAVSAPPTDEQPAPEPAPVPEAPQRTIEQLLADPTFDREGKVRSRLAAISAKGPVGQYPPADLVDEHEQSVDVA